MEQRSTMVKKVGRSENKASKQQQQQFDQNENSSLTSLLRTLLRQKEADGERLRGENERLKKLLVKQQSLLNKLNEDNLVLANSHSTCCLSPAISHQQDEENDENGEELINSSLKQQQDCANYELIEQNRSLREQLLVAQNYGARLLKELNEAKQNMKLMSKLLVNRDDI